MKSAYKIRTKVWLYPGPPAGGGGWHFVSIPAKISVEIKEKHGKHARGWRSIPVSVTLGKSIWKTSIFPDKGGIYLLPLKAAVRQKEGIVADDFVQFTLHIA